jgi:hypothetical protein
MTTSITFRDTNSDVGEPTGNAVRRQRYRETDNGRDLIREAHKRENDRRRVERQSRPFLMWDGEGVTGEDGIHRYVLLAHSEGESIVRDTGLRTKEITEFLLDTARTYADFIHFGYGLGYDINMWLRTLKRADIMEIYRSRWHDVKHTRYGWRPGKSFYLRRGKTALTVYDAISFFQCSFVAACDSYLGPEFADRDLIVENKRLRAAFNMEDIENIKRYNDAELRNGVRLMTELRTRLANVGLAPTRWDGPGAVATALLDREGVKHAKAGHSRAGCRRAKTCDGPQFPRDVPDGVARATRFAYAGGRFEIIRTGSVDARTYEYDINSAYPGALRNVPALANGRWIHHPGDPGERQFTLYHVDYRRGPVEVPGPLFRRMPDGSVCYPPAVTGWYWSPEMDSLRRYTREIGGEYDVVEAWEYVEDGPPSQPFGFIDGLYLKRQALKRGGDGAHVGIKLGLNSLYGKLAQQVGWIPATGDKPIRIPPYHELAWAGYTTSHCRASVLNAAMERIEDIVAFETDALFTRKPLSVKIGTGLGEWERTEFTRLAYLQSGLYFGTTADGKAIERTRGVDRGELTLEQVHAVMALPLAADRVVPARLSRFVGAGLANATQWSKWNTWDVLTKRVSVEPVSPKRLHEDCPSCNGEPGIRLGVWHTTLCQIQAPGHSCEFPIEWINPDPEMTELSELREEGYELWDGMEQ